MRQPRRRLTPRQLRRQERARKWRASTTTPTPRSSGRGKTDNLVKQKETVDVNSCKVVKSGKTAPTSSPSKLTASKVIPGKTFAQVTAGTARVAQGSQIGSATSLAKSGLNKVEEKSNTLPVSQVGKETKVSRTPKVPIQKVFTKQVKPLQTIEQSKTHSRPVISVNQLQKAETPWCKVRKLANGKVEVSNLLVDQDLILSVDVTETRNSRQEKESTLCNQNAQCANDDYDAIDQDSDTNVNDCVTNHLQDSEDVVLTPDISKYSINSVHALTSHLQELNLHTSFPRHCPIILNSRPFTALLDSGNLCGNVISESVIRKLGMTMNDIEPVHDH